MNGPRPPKEQLQKFNDLEQLIFSIAKKFGFDKYVGDFDQKFKEFFPTQRLEGDNDILGCIEYYDEDVLWEDLSLRLSERDFQKAYGEKKINKMALLERLEKEQPFIDKYWKEFGEYGLERLEVRENMPATEIPEVGRNDPCPCGSGKKYKKCHGK